MLLFLLRWIHAKLQKYHDLVYLLLCFIGRWFRGSALRLIFFSRSHGETNRRNYFDTELYFLWAEDRTRLFFSSDRILTIILPNACFVL